MSTKNPQSRAVATGAEAVGTKRGRPTKGEDAKSTLLRVRVTPEQRRLLTLAAERAGLDVSSWLRSVGMEKARAMGIE